MSTLTQVRHPSTTADLPPTILGTGLVALDVILSAESKSPPTFAAGGTCANVLTALSYLGWQSFPVARLGRDTASKLVRSDLAKWKVKLDFASQTPTTQAPIIVQHIRRNKHGQPTHRFAWMCPECGTWLPAFRPITMAGAEVVAEAAAARVPKVAPSVFFFDRVSPGALSLAKTFFERGALIVFEPSANGDLHLLPQALRLAHIVKFSRERMPGLLQDFRAARNSLLDIETLGNRGFRYRTSLGRARNVWHRVDAPQLPSVVDTAGAGDWFTAALLNETARVGVEGLEGLRVKDLTNALLRAQIAAGWTCQFEGARGGMYQVSPAAFKKMIVTSVPSLAQQGHTGRNHAHPRKVNSATPNKRRRIADICPSCPPRKGNAQSRRRVRR